MARQKKVDPPADPPPPTQGSTSPTLEDMLSAAGDSDNDGDEDTPSITDGELISWVMECRREAYDARRTRVKLNNINRDAYMSIQDFSHKQKGQSAEFLPKTSVAAEQFGAFIKKALVQFGDWFQVKLSPEIKPYITEGQIRALIKLYLAQLPDGHNKKTNIETRLADGGKLGLLESLMIFKVYGKEIEINSYEVDPKEQPPTLTIKKSRKWRLAIDSIRSEDYFPDPTGRGLYEIHEVERDWIDVFQSAKAGVYDLETVEKLRDEDHPKSESIYEKRRPQQQGQDRSTPPAHRHRILLTEFWGTVINAKGEIVADNQLCTVANKKHLIRHMETNPLWHGESPFIAEPLIRVPHSVWHKALYDSVSQLNFAINELFNLMLDGGIASVWGIKQLRIDHLADPRQVENGIPQGITLQVKDTLPADMKVLENVSEIDGTILQSGNAIFGMLDREFQSAALTTDTMQGELPQRQVKATEITAANQSQSTTLSSIAMDMEVNVMERMLRLSWLTMLQHIEDFTQNDIVQAVGQKAATLLLGLDDATRFSIFAGACSFTVSGLSAVLAATQDFQKLMAFFQAVSQNPILMKDFIGKYDPGKVLDLLMKHLNINPDDIAATETPNIPQLIQQYQMFAQLTGGGQATQSQPGAPAGGSQDGTGGVSGGAPSPPQGPTLGAPPGSPVGTMAAVNQQIQPLTGLQVGH